MAGSAAPAAPTSRRGVGGWLAGWLSSALLMVVVLATIVATQLFHQAAGSSRQAQLALASLTGQLDEQSRLEALAMGDQYRAAPQIWSSIKQSMQLDDEIADTIRGLPAAHVPTGSVAAIRKAVDRYQDALRAEYQELLTGDWAAAWARDRTVARPRYGDVTALIADETNRIGHIADDSDRTAMVGSLVAMVLGTAMCGLIAHQRGRARRSADYHRVLRRSEERFRSLVHNASDVIVIADPDTTIRYVTASVHRMLQYDVETLTGTSLLDYVHHADREVVTAMFADPDHAHPGAGAPQWRVRGAGGTWSDVECLLSNLVADPNVGGLVLTLRDVTQRKRLELELRHQAFHDPLTGLANRTLFNSRLSEGTSGGAVLLVDLDDFKQVNDRLGHAAGDQLLVIVAERLKSSIRQCDTVARLGGDEFAVLLTGIDPAEADHLVTRLLANLLEPVHVEGELLRVSASIGVAFSESADDTDPDRWLRNADAAMYAAKRQGKGRQVRYPVGVAEPVRSG